MSPAFAILLIAPFMGESLSGSTPPLDLLLPWNLALVAGLYGTGALICREVTRQFRFGLTGFALLGAAYGVYEEGLVDRYWFYPQFWQDSGVGDYSLVWHTNLLLATHLTVFHTVVSIGASVLIVERLFPDHRDRPWVGRPGLVIAAVVLFVVVPVFYGDYYSPGAPQLIAAGAIGILLVVGAFLTPRLRERPAVPPSGPRRGIAWIAFACTTTHFVAVYALPSTGVPWPIGIALSLVPVGVGVLLIRRLSMTDAYGTDGLRAITGVVAFFIGLDFVVGLGGRYDMSVGAIATAFALRWLHRRDRGSSAARAA